MIAKAYRPRIGILMGEGNLSVRIALRSLLQAEGFSNIRVQLESTDRESENGRVLDQSPSAGKSTSTDDQITLVVGQFSGGGSTPTDGNSGGGN